MARPLRIFPLLFTCCFMLLSILLEGQSLIQTVRGRVTDHDSRVPLPGVNVVVVDSNMFLGGSTNEQGEFFIENVPVGRVSLKISYIGYEERLLSNLLITSGKEKVLVVDLQESMFGLIEVIVCAIQTK